MKKIKKIFRPDSILIKLFLCLFVIMFLLLGFTDYLNPIKQLLDSENLSFHFGKIRVSVYLVLKSLVTLIILFWIAGILSDFGERKIKRLRQIKASNRALIIKAYQVSIYLVATLIILDVLGINFAALALAGGAIGIGIGFGLQKITSNFISGLILLFEKSVEEGDLVELDDGTSGFIKYTGARYTLLETFENRELMIPNEDFITKRVTNWTFSNNLGRIEIVIGISYDSDIEKAHLLIIEAAKESRKVSKVVPPECYLVDFAESSVNFRLLFWVDNIIEGRNKPRSDVLFAIWDKFKKNNIKIPYPQRDIHIIEQNNE